MAKVNDLPQLHPTDCTVLMAIRNSFSEWKYYYDYGYICYIQGTTKLYEHRLVAAASPDLDVHHIDGCITNNASYNLVTLTPKEHALIHHPSTKVQKTCLHCGAPFLVIPRKLDQSKYCSAHCRHLGNRKVQRPSSEELTQAIQLTPNWSELGRRYGVSDAAIRKWLKAYGITARIDGRKKQP